VSQFEEKSMSVHTSWTFPTTSTIEANETMSYQSQQQGQHASASFNQADGANVEMTSEAASIPETFAQDGPQLRTQTASATMTITETAVAQHEILQLTLRGTPTVTW
jgi:hypothetical protein